MRCIQRRGVRHIRVGTNDDHRTPFAVRVDPDQRKGVRLATRGGKRRAVVPRISTFLVDHPSRRSRMSGCASPNSSSNTLSGMVSETSRVRQPLKRSKDEACQLSACAGRSTRAGIGGTATTSPARRRKPVSVPEVELPRAPSAPRRRGVSSCAAFVCVTSTYSPRGTSADMRQTCRVDASGCFLVVATWVLRGVNPFYTRADASTSDKRLSAPTRWSAGCRVLGGGHAHDKHRYMAPHVAARLAIDRLLGTGRIRTSAPSRNLLYDLAIRWRRHG